MYCSEDKESVSNFISRSDPKIKKKYEFLLRFIADETNQLKESYVKHFSIERFKQFYELQLKAAKTMIRIIYYKADENIILLHAFNTRDKRDIAAILTFFLLPSINKGKNGTVKVIKLTQQVASGTKIEESTLEEKEEKLQRIKLQKKTYYFCNYVRSVYIYHEFFESETFRTASESVVFSACKRKCNCFKLIDVCVAF